MDSVKSMSTELFDRSFKIGGAFIYISSNILQNKNIYYGKHINIIYISIYLYINSKLIMHHSTYKLSINKIKM